MHILSICGSIGATCVLLSLLWMGKSNALADTASFTNGDQSTKVVHFAPKQIIQIIAPITSISKNTATSAQHRNAYYETAIPLAQRYGFVNHLQLNVTQTLVGDFTPPVYIIGSWPSVDAFNLFMQTPQWPTMKKLRIEAWDELKLFNGLVHEPTTLTFKEDKFYTVVFAWKNAENPTDYDQYLLGIENALNRVGGHFILKLNDLTMESHTSTDISPDRITFVEWDTEDGFAVLQQQDDYKKYTALRDSGVSKLEFHKLSANFKQ